MNVWPLIILLVGLFTFIVWIFWSSQLKAIANQYNETQLVIVKSAAQGIEEFIIPLMRELDHLSRLPSVRYMEDLERLDKSLSISFQRLKFQILNFARINENGVVTYTYPYNNDLQNQNLSEREYVQQVKTTGKRAVSHPFITPDGNRVIALADPIRTKDGEFLGIIQAWVSLESLKQLFIFPILSETNTSVFIYDKDGYLIEGPNENLTGQHYSQFINSEDQPGILELITRMIDGEQGKIIHPAIRPITQEQDKHQVKMITAFAPIRFLLKDQWWSIAISTPYNTAIVLSRKILKDEIILILITAIIIVVISIFLLARERKTKNVIKESENKFKNLAEQSPNMICINRGRQILYVNKKCEEITGYKREEFFSPDFNFFTIIDPESREIVETTYKKHMEGNEVSPYEISLINKEGKIIEAIATTKLIDYEGDHAVLGIVTDITEHKKAEKERQESENRYRTLFEGVPMGLYRTTPEGRILDVNPELIYMLGYPDRKSLLAINAKDIYVDPKDRKRWQTIMDIDGIVSNLEYKIRQYDGEIIWVQDTARVVVDDKGLVLFYEGSLHDITERKKSEEELLEAKQKAEKALNELKEYQTLMVQKERLAVLGELSSGLAHEINNPLSIISGYMQMLLMDEHVNSEIKEISKIIEKQVKRASNIADKLLHFSKRTDFEIKEVDVNQLVENILILLEHQLKQFNILVVKQLNPTLGSIQADPPQLQQVFHNIISNAIYVMPKGGTLTVSTGLKDGFVEIRFSDTGCGIPKKDLNRIFDPFFSTKEPGTGLGLSIAYGIIDAHRGQIEVESQENEGAMFILKLPVKNKTIKRNGKNGKNISC